MVHFKYLEYFLSNEPHAMLIYLLFMWFKRFLNFPGFTGNDVLIAGKLDILAETSTQIIRIGPRKNCANFHTLSTICIFSPFSYTIKENKGLHKLTSDIDRSFFRYVRQVFLPRNASILSTVLLWKFPGFPGNDIIWGNYLVGPQIFCIG